MAAGPKESLWEKFKEFFTQKPADHKYEKKGGDARIDPKDRTSDPKRDANLYAASRGEEAPWPDHAGASGTAD